jgi:hypothetical protein
MSIAQDLLRLIYTSLKTDNMGTRAELVALGLTDGCVDRITHLDDDDLAIAASKPIFSLRLERERLAGLYDMGHITREYLTRGASNDLVRTFLGLSEREIRVQRQAQALPANTGRPLQIDAATQDTIRQAWAALSLPRAERLLHVAQQYPMYSITSLWAVVR